MISISEPFIRRPVFTMMITITCVVFGIFSYMLLPVDDLPNVDTPVISVSAGYPGADPVTMANTVATPLEQQFLQIAGIQQVTSSSTQGSTSITIEFVLDKNIDGAATDVQTAITQATGSLPALPFPPTYKKRNPNDIPIVYLAVTSDTLTLGQLYELASTQVGQRISVLEGVASVDVYGAQPAVRVEVDPSKIAYRGLSLSDVISGIQAGTQYVGAGQFYGPNRSYQLAPQGQLSTADEYNQLIIKQQDDRPIYLSDVASAIDALNSDTLSMDLYLKGGNPNDAGVIVAVTKAAGANVVEVAQKVIDQMPEIERTLPGAAKLTLMYNRSQSVVNSVDDVKETLIIAFALVVIVIFVFLGRAKDTIIPSIALPLSLLVTFIPMWAMKFSLDNLSLMGLVLAIGFLVDDAIVFLENTVRRMETFGEDAMTAAGRSAREISFTILSMTLSLAAVFIPLVFMPGQIGRVFFEFGMTIIIAIMASGAVSLTLTPLMCSRMLAGRGRDSKKTGLEKIVNKVFAGIIAIYGKSLYFFLRHKWLSVAIWIISLYLSVDFFNRLPKSFLPVGDSGFIRGIFMAEQGASPQRMMEYQKSVDAVLQNNPNLTVGMTLVGLSSTGAAPNQGITIGFLGPRDERDPIMEVNEQLAGKMFQIPGILPLIRPVPELQISSGTTSTSQGAYAFQISGIEPEQVYTTATELQEKFSKIPGVANVSSDLQLKSPKIEMEILRDQASSYGVTAEAIESAISQAYAQNWVYLIKTPNDQHQVIVEAKPNERSKPTDLDKLYVSSSNGSLVPLRAVIRWNETVGPQAVNHINQFTSVTLYFDLARGTSIGSITDAIQQIAANTIPAGVNGQLSGEADIFTQLFSAFPILLAFAVFAMYVILGILYESYLHPLTVLSALPVAAVGGLATLLIFGEDFSFYAIIGIFMLIGIVKKNGIMIVDFALQRMGEGKGRVEAVHEACLERFRPIMMTTLAAIMGAVPMAMGWGASGETRVGLGLCIVGGLIFSQLITLYITPVIFLYFEALQENVLDKIPFFRSTRGDSVPA